MDILLEGEHYTLTSTREDGERNWYYQQEALDMLNLQSTVKGLRAKNFTRQTPEQKEEISLTLYLDKENFPEVHIQLYRYDGKDCIAVVDGKTTAFVDRERVVDLMEAETQKASYSHLKRQQCALNMQIRLAMQSYDMDMKEKLEKELQDINQQMKYFG